jgi:tetratricopeptide (TPR) repeat protein
MPYKRGHAYFMAGEYETAAADFETACRDRKNMANAQWYWALSLLAQKGRTLNDGALRQLLLSVNENDNAERYRKARAILSLIEGKPQ